MKNVLKFAIAFAVLKIIVDLVIEHFKSKH